MKKIQWLILTGTLYLVIITLAAFLFPDWLHQHYHETHPINRQGPDCSYTFLAVVLWVILTLGGLIFITSCVEEY